MIYIYHTYISYIFHIYISYVYISYIYIYHIYHIYIYLNGTRDSHDLYPSKITPRAAPRSSQAR